MPNKKITEYDELSVVDFSDLFEVVEAAGSPESINYNLTAARLFGLGGFTPGGRLTTESGVAVGGATQAATLYYTPYLHNRVRVWDGTRWLLKTFSEISLALTLTSGKNYDVFLDDDAATLSLSAAWTNDTTRADALGTQDSVRVLNSDKTKLFLGSIRAGGTNTTDETVRKMYVSNYYNKTGRLLAISNSTSHSYTTGAFRYWNNDQALTQLEFLLCDPLEEEVYFAFQGYHTSGIGSLYSIGINGTSPASIMGNPLGRFSGAYLSRLATGYHTVSNVEFGVSGSNFNECINRIIVRS